MAQSRTRFLGMDVHKDAIAVASVAQAQGAEGMSLGTMGTRQYDIALLIGTRPSQAKHLLCGYAAGPCGSWLSRSLTKKGAACWGAPPICARIRDNLGAAPYLMRPPRVLLGRL
jgi:hypothetical protein